MEFKVRIQETDDNGNPKIVERAVLVRPLFVREREKAFNMLLEMEGSEEGETMKLSKKYLDEIDALTYTTSKLNKDLEIVSEDFDKINEYIQKQVQGKLDFLKSSLNAESSLEKESQA